MKSNFIENHFTFQRNLVDENAFAIQDITLCNIHDQIPLHHYPLTYFDDNIVLVQRNTEYFCIIYSICSNSNRFYNFLECEKEEHDFKLNNRYYKIDRYECSDLFVRIYVSTDKLEGVKYNCNASEPRLILHNLESHFYCLNDAKERKNNGLEHVVLMTINAYKPKVIDKLFCLMIFVKNCSYYLYCIQKIEKEYIRCNVIMSRHYYLSFYQLFSCDKTNKIIKRMMNIEIENSKIVSLTCEQLCSVDKQMENIRPEEHNCLDTKTIEFRPPTNILDNLMHHLNPKTLIYILRAVFSEQKLVLLSTNANMLSLVTIAVKNCIHPFAYNNTTFSILPEDVSHMLDIPFPFIFGIIGTMKDFKSRKIPKEVLAIDLDSEEVNMKIRPKLSYEFTLENRLLSESWSTLLPRFFNMIQNNIDIAREKMIHTYINTENFINIINNPKTIIEKINNDYIDFYTRFFDTKIFQDYIFDQNECRDNVKLCLTADNCLVTDVMAINHDVYKLWHYIAIQDDTEDSLQISVKDFSNAQKLVLLPYLFDIFSRRNDYDAIRELYKFLICNDIRITPDMYKNINRRTKGCSMVFYKSYDLSAYKIEVSQSLTNNIDCKDGSFDLFKDDKKICTIRTIGVEGIYSEMRRRKCVSTKEVFMLQNPDLFWNIIFYFKLSNLPINLCDDSKRDKRTDIDLLLHIKPN